jgi:hypothetical protein
MIVFADLPMRRRLTRREAAIGRMISNSKEDTTLSVDTAEPIRSRVIAGIRRSAAT